MEPTDVLKQCNFRKREFERALDIIGNNIKYIFLFMGIGIVFAAVWTAHLASYHRVCAVDGRYQCVVTNK